MPELPEVEIIKLGLEKKIIGLKIQKIQVLSPKSFIGNPDLVQGQKVLKVWRRAKILGVDLTPSILSKTKDLSRMRVSNELGDSSLVAQNDQGVTLLFHMKMSGQLVYISGDERITNNDEHFVGGHPTEDMLGKMPNSHTRVIFNFSDGSHLYFNDQRRFGWIKIANSQQLTANSLLQKLGPEPLEKEFTWQILKQNLLRHKNMAIKVAIMDQSVVSGVGNIYANETCFDAKIDPRKKVSQLSDQDFQSLHRGVIKSLRDGIKYGGSTRVHFVDPEGPPATLGVAMRAGRKGYFLDYAFVYGKDKHPCKVCGTEIKKIQLGGRGTYFCPACQR